MRENKEIQYRIDYEIIVDCYDEYEVNMGWYYYFTDNLEFPIKAKVNLNTRKGQSLKDVEIVEVSSLENREIELGVVFDDMDLIIPISIDQIKEVNTTKENLQVLNDLLYWKDEVLLK